MFISTKGFFYEKIWRVVYVCCMAVSDYRPTEQPDLGYMLLLVVLCSRRSIELSHLFILISSSLPFLLA